MSENVKITEKFLELIGVKAEELEKGSISYFYLNDKPIHKKTNNSTERDNYLRSGVCFESTLDSQQMVQNGVSAKLSVYREEKRHKGKIDHSIHAGIIDGEVKDLDIKVEDKNIFASLHIVRNFAEERRGVSEIQAHFNIKKNRIIWENNKMRFLDYHENGNRANLEILAVSDIIRHIHLPKKRHKYGRSKKEFSAHRPFDMCITTNEYYPNKRFKTKKDALLLLRNGLLHPHTKCTLREVEMIINEAFPGIMNLIRELIPEYEQYTTGSYDKDQELSKDLDATVPKDSSLPSYFDIKGLVWRAKREKLL